jgi:hypothetical protein
MAAAYTNGFVYVNEGVRIGRRTVQGIDGERFSEVITDTNGDAVADRNELVGTGLRLTPVCTILRV